MSKNVVSLPVLNYIHNKCSSAGINIKLKNVKYLRFKGSTSTYLGYFCCTSRTIVVAAKNPCYQEVLIHEYCHYLQWRENADVWLRCYPKYKTDSLNLFDDWLLGSRVHKVKKHIAAVRDLELDCEQRAAWLMRKNKFGDVSSYIRKANAYVLWHNWIGEIRSMDYTYQDPDVLKAMSNKWDMNYESLDSHILEVFKMASKKHNDV
jgi:hypothetical protein